MKLLNILGMATLLMALASCDYQELCYDHRHNDKATVRVPVDWSHFDEDSPSGMTVIAYPDEEATAKSNNNASGNAGKPQTVLSNYLKHAEMSLPIGSYHFLVFNQSEGEYGSLVFEGMDSYSTARALAKTYQSRWYKSRGDNDEQTGYSPEWLAAGSTPLVSVTKEMVDAADEEFTLVTDTVKPRNVISTVNVRVHVKNIYNIRSARASLTGLAAGYQFATGKPTTQRITQLIEEWKLTPDEDNPSNGTLTATFQSFGLPADHQNLPEENELDLSLLLVDNQTQKDFSFQVGNSFVKHSSEDADTSKDADEDGSTNTSGSTSIDTDVDISTDVDVDLDLDLNLEVEAPIEDVKPEGGSSGGFDATVEDWGEEVKIDINA